VNGNRVLLFIEEGPRKSSCDNTRLAGPRLGEFGERESGARDGGVSMQENNAINKYMYIYIQRKRYIFEWSEP